jgi:ubiquinone/menaquinone biosynthesis C-methylase UbiE
MEKKLSNRAEESRDFLQRETIHSQWESDYLNPDMDHFYNLVFEDILKQLRPSRESRLLDAGCGYCYHTVRLANSGAKITAIDFSSAALARAQTTINRAGISDQVTLQQADLTALPFENESFDFVISWGVLMHIPDVERALSELARVLKSRGILVLSETNMASPDIAIREKAIYLVKKMLRKGNSQINRTERGIEVWEQGEIGGLMVRKMNISFLKRFASSLGLTEFTRTPGQFSEVYTNMPYKSLKRIVYAFNSFYFRHRLPPAFAASNIIYFQKH